MRKCSVAETSAKKITKITIPRTWKSITNQSRKSVQHIKYEETFVPFPDFWKVDKGKFAPLKIRARNILKLLSYLLVDAEIMFDHKDELRFKFKPKYNSNKKKKPHTTSEEDRSYSDIMSSKWAEETEKELLSRTEEKEGRATLLPIIFNSDGVALGETNQQVNTVLATCGLFSDYLIRQLVSKVCVGYIPKPTIFKEEAINHLQTVCGLSRSKAENAFGHYERDVVRCFWDLVLGPVKEANKKGVYMLALGTNMQVLLMYPYVVAHVGDEPGQKQICGMYEGNASRFCVHCDYQFGTIYNRDTNVRRDSSILIPLCAIAEKALVKKLSVPERCKTITNREVKALAAVKAYGIHPMRNAFHSAPMGYQNSVYRFPYDLLHTLCGIMKNILFCLLVIIERISASTDKRFKKARSLYDSRLRNFPMQPDCLPHVHHAIQKSSLTHLLSSKSNKQKGLSANSMGRIPSVRFVSLLLNSYFAIGTCGDVLPNTHTFKYVKKNTNKKKEVEEIKDAKSKKTKPAKQKEKKLDLGNVTEKVLLTIELILSVYFQCKRTSHTAETNKELRRSVGYFQAQYAVLRDLLKTVLGEPPSVDKARKPHFLDHIDETIELFGAIDHFDTGPWEFAHIWNSTGNWNSTSKRYLLCYNE
jgi:Plavaka transposase